MAFPSATPMDDYLPWKEAVWAEICAERSRAHKLHGPTSAESEAPYAHRRHTILSEEVGEVARCLNDGDHSAYMDRRKLREELVQTAAMIVAWIAAIDGHSYP